MLIRDLLQDIGGEEDDFHRTFNGSPIVKVDDCLNLSKVYFYFIFYTFFFIRLQFEFILGNSDLLACTVVAKDG